MGTLIVFTKDSKPLLEPIDYEFIILIVVRDASVEFGSMGSILLLSGDHQHSQHLLHEGPQLPSPISKTTTVGTLVFNL